jgi:thioredoxin reductase
MTPTRHVEEPDVLIVGAGPAGLTAAARLAPHVAGEVLVLDREAEAGGIPRHSNHTGYGLRDLRTILSGPSYARRLAHAASSAGATIRTRSMVTGWAADRAALVTSPDGVYVVRPRATILATGARERPRAARRIPGDRPQGIYTTGQLQSLVHLQHASPGSRAVVIGAELVSWSAVLTLREAGCSVAALVTRHSRPESYAALNLTGRLVFRTPVVASSRVVNIVGKRRVEAIELEDRRTGLRRRIACDTVVFTGDWVPDNELARMAELDLDPSSLSPVVDTALRSSRPGIFAAGNLVHPVDTADVAALDGMHVAEQVRRWLTTASTTAAPHVRLVVEPPFEWIAPGIVRQGDPAPARSRLLLGTDSYVRFPKVSISQRGLEIASERVPWPAAPGRVFRLPSRFLEQIDFTAGDVAVQVTRAQALKSRGWS